MTLNQAIETAKAKAAGNAKWTRAIERAAQNGHSECYHRAAVRLVEMMETALAVSSEVPKIARVPTITRSIERDIITHRPIHVVRTADGWLV